MSIEGRFLRVRLQWDNLCVLGRTGIGLKGSQSGEVIFGNGISDGLFGDLVEHGVELNSLDGRVNAAHEKL